MDPEIAELITALNQTGGIPLRIVSTQDWTQFYTGVFLAILSSIIVFIFMWQFIKPAISDALCLLKLRGLRKLTGRHFVLIKHTESALFSASMIDTSTMMRLEKALKKFKGAPFDLILHTPGGELFSAQIISRVLRKYPNKIRAFIPFYAMSGGTLLALSCDEILMSDTASLGPVDPQIGSLFRYGSAQSWNQVIKRKGRKAEDASIQLAYMGEQYSKTMQLMISDVLIDKISDGEKRVAAVEFLTSGKVEHGYPITAVELNKFGILTGVLPKKIKDMMVDVINSQFFEGVYYS